MTKRIEHLFGRESGGAVMDEYDIIVIRNLPVDYIIIGKTYYVSLRYVMFKVGK